MILAIRNTVTIKEYHSLYAFLMCEFPLRFTSKREIQVNDWISPISYGKSFLDKEALIDFSKTSAFKNLWKTFGWEVYEIKRKL